MAVRVIIGVCLEQASDFVDVFSRLTGQRVQAEIGISPLVEPLLVAIVQRLLQIGHQNRGQHVSLGLE